MIPFSFIFILQVPPFKMPFSTGIHFEIDFLLHFFFYLCLYFFWASCHVIWKGYFSIKNVIFSVFLSRQRRNANYVKMYSILFIFTCVWVLPFKKTKFTCFFFSDPTQGINIYYLSLTPTTHHQTKQQELNLNTIIFLFIFNFYFLNGACSTKSPTSSVHLFMGTHLFELANKTKKVLTLLFIIILSPLQTNNLKKSWKISRTNNG